MEFKRKGPEVAELTCNSGRRILFSYGEPVALILPAAQDDGPVCVRTDRYISRTTERHIQEFAAAHGVRARRVAHEKILTATKETC